MAQISRQVGTTSQVTLLFIQDSSSTTGAGLTGLAYNTGSLTCYYKRSNGTASVAVTLANITTLGTYVSGGFKEVDATNLPGVYEFHPPNAALASGADSVAFLLKGATNMAPCPLVIELTGTSNQDATAGGISRLDAAVSSRMATYTQPTGFLTATFPTTVASTTNITAGTITTVGTTTNLTNLPSIPANWLTAAGIASGALDGKGNWNVGKTGYSLTATTGLGNQTADITGSLSGSVGSVTGNVGGNVAGSVGSISGVSFPSGFSTLTTATIADQVWDEILSGHAGVGSAGAALSAAGGSGDPWSTALPGAYSAGTAGYIVGTNLDALISSRMATYTQPTGFLAATFPTTVASTTNITAATGITVATNNDKAGYSLSQSFPSNFASLAITAGGIVQADLQTIKTQTVTCAGGVTVPAATLASTTNITAGTITTVSGVTGLTTSAIADQVWDEILSGHAGAGSAGAALATASSGGVDPGILADAVWDELMSGHTTPGSAGNLVGTYLDAAVSTRSTYAGGDTAGTTTLLSRVTAAVALAGSAPSWYATTGLKLASDGLDSVAIESGINARQAVSAIMASAAGVLSGATTGTIVIKGGGVAITRITATTDADGNRSAITLNLPS